MKKIFFLYITVMSVCLCACNRKAPEKNMVAIENQEFVTKEIEETEPPNNTLSETVVPISDKEITIPYEGSLDICFIANVDNIIFLAGVESDSGIYAIHKMKIEDNTSEKLPLNIPSDLMIQAFNLDIEGNIHIFLTDSDKSVQRCEMWVSDQEGRVIRKIDMREAFPIEGSFGQIVTDFVIDGEGRYYISGNRFREISQSGITIIEADGQILGLVDSPDSHLWGIYSMARGNDGKIYLSNNTRNSEMAVMSIDPEGLCIGECYEDVLPSGYGSYTGAHAGINADLFFFGDAGIYSYDLGDESGKQIIAGSMFPFSGEVQLCQEFLTDGRFLLVDGDRRMKTEIINGNEYLINSGEIYQNVVFYYIPVVSAMESESNN